MVARLGDLLRPEADPQPYKRRRWCVCEACGVLVLVFVSRHARLRTRPSPCCGARLRPRGWRPKITALAVFKALARD